MSIDSASFGLHFVTVTFCMVGVALAVSVIRVRAFRARFPHKTQRQGVRVIPSRCGFTGQFL